MLSLRNRLRTKKDIERVLNQGQLFFSPCFNIKVLANNFSHPRFAIIVSLKISKKAVVRNKTKRQIRAIIRDNMANIRGNYDIVIITKPAIVTMSYGEIKRQLVSFL